MSLISPVSPFGSGSIFYKPTINADSEGDGSVPAKPPTNLAAGSQKRDGIWVFFWPFDTASAMEQFISSDLYIKELNPKLIIICAFVKDDNSSNAYIHIGYSADLSNILSSPGFDFDETLNDYAKEIKKRGEKHGLAYDKSVIRTALDNAIPLSKKRLQEKSILTKQQQQLYDDNYKMLISLAENPDDPQIENAILVLCKAIIETNGDVLKSYNQYPDVRYNSNYNKKKLSAYAILHMAKRLKQLQGQVRNLQNGNFKTAEDVVQFVNNNLVDTSAIGEETKFVINYPFQKLSYTRRKEILLYFIDGRDLSFSGFFRSTSYEMGIVNQRITEGDIVYNLFATASKTEKIQLITELSKEKKIYDLMHDSYFGLFGWLCTEIGEAYFASLENKEQLLLQTISKGNFIFFDNSFLGNRNAENFEENQKKLSFEVTQSAIYSVPQLSICKDFIDKHFANNAHLHLTPKKVVDPLELVVIIPAADMTTGIFSDEDSQMLKGKLYLMPACMVYALFREDTQQAIKIFVNLTIQVGLCFIGVGALTAAIRAGSALGVVAATTDITLGALGATVNTIPEIARNHPDFAKYVNYATLIYGVARLGYTAYKSAKIERLSNSEKYDAVWLTASKEERQLLLMSRIGGKPMDPKLFKNIKDTFTARKNNGYGRRRC